MSGLSRLGWVEGLEGRVLWSGVYNHMGTTGVGFAPVGETLVYSDMLDGEVQRYTRRARAYSGLVNGYKVFRVTVSNDPRGSQYYSFVKGVGEVEVGEDVSNWEGDGTVLPTEREYFYPPKPTNRSWEGILPESGETDSAQVSRERDVVTAMGRQTVKVPGGKFVNAVKIHFTSYDVDINEDGSESVDDGFGVTVWTDAVHGFVVKEQTDDGSEVKVLLSYKAGGSGAGAPKVPVQLPDLVGGIGSNSLVGTIGADMSVSGSVGVDLANNGLGVVGKGSRPITVTVFARPVDGGEDVVMGTATGILLSGLGVGQTRRIMVPVEAELSEGDYVTGVEVDSGNVLGESAKFNNVFVDSGIISAVDF